MLRACARSRRDQGVAPVSEGKKLDMTGKSVITLLLLLFVGASVGYFVYQESVGRGGGPRVEDWSQVEHKVVAYFFHASQRCETCRKIESYAREALEGPSYADAWRSGLLEWRDLSYEDPRNEELVREYGVLTSTVVLVAWRQGQDKRWKNLERVWELVHDKNAFIEYVRSEATPMVGASDG